MVRAGVAFQWDGWAVSIKLMTMVFDRYPAGGTERLLALAVADHARDDGTRIWPSVGELARKTVQSERSVQRMLLKMQLRQWLLLVRRATGRPGDTNEYRINPAWIAGQELPTGDNLSPVQCEEEGEPGPETGDNLSPVRPAESVDKVIHTGDSSDETGDSSDETGDIAVSPESSGTIKNQYPLTPAGAGDVDKAHRGQNNRIPRPPWRWRQSFEGICARGEQLGLPYSTAALGNSYTDDQLRAHRKAYERRVLQASDDCEQLEGRRA